MKRRFWILMVLSGFFAVLSCEEDDICIGEGTPNLTVVFRNNLGNENLKDTLTIEFDRFPDFPDPDTIYRKVFTDSVKLPLAGLNTDKAYYRIKRRSNPVKDVLTVDYESKTEYVSKACGFRLVYRDLSYSSTFNFIELLESAENNDLTDETITNLYINLSD